MKMMIMMYEFMTGAIAINIFALILSIVNDVSQTFNKNTCILLCAKAPHKIAAARTLDKPFTLDEQTCGTLQEKHGKNL